MKVIWTTKDDRKILVSEMEDTHLLNTIRFIQAKRDEGRIKWWTWRTEEEAMIYEAIKRGLVEKMFYGWKAWKGVGYCRARNIHETNDFCNNKTITNGQYCRKCTCSVKGCKNNATRWWPLLAGNPGLCNHHSKNPPKGYWTNLVQAANAPPDDFDIPDECW